MSEILSNVENRVLTLTFNRPEKMNALTRSMYSGLAKGLNDAAGDFGIRAVVLTAAGDHFTAGNDIVDFMNNPPTSDDSEVAQFLAALLNFPKPLIGAVKGNAVGVGTTMLLHCDVVIAGPTAKFSMPFASLGLVPEAGSSYLFPQLVGYQRAARIFMTGESFDTDSAIEWDWSLQMILTHWHTQSELPNTSLNNPHKRSLIPRHFLKLVTMTLLQLS
jgi:enoyl-CoA hydratase/carnithine racemase